MNHHNESQILYLTICKELKEKNIVTEFNYHRKANLLKISLNYNGICHRIPLTINKNNWSENAKTITKKLIPIGVDQQIINLITYSLDENVDQILEINNWDNPNSVVNDESDACDVCDKLNNDNNFVIEEIGSQLELEYNQKDQDNNTINKAITIISPSQALRKGKESCKVKGTIISISIPFKMISKVQFHCNYCKQHVEFNLPLPVLDIHKNCVLMCKKCKNVYTYDNFNPIHINAIKIELQDSETFNELERLPVFLFDHDTEGIKVGESVIITGITNIIKNKNRYFTYLYAKSIEYLDREEFNLTNLEIDAIKRFAQNKFDKKYKGSVIDQLVKMTDPSIVEHNHAKKAILISAVNTSCKMYDDSEHIDVLFIGPPGTGKTKMLIRATKLVPGSKYAGGQYSSGKSLTAIVDKTDDNTILRLGLIPLSRDAFCAINEFGRLAFEDQGKLLDVMQERQFSFDKYGIHAIIQSPVSILASANPMNKDTWINDDKIDLNEFPFLEPIKDRFDLIIVFENKKTDEERDIFADKLSEIEAKKELKKIPDYTYFLTRYIQYAKQISRVTITDEARIMLTEFYKKISKNSFGSPRVLITLYKLTKGVARLKLKDVADEEDAKEVMEFYNATLIKLQKNVTLSKSPKVVAYEKAISVVERFKENGISLEELFKILCHEDGLLADYFGCGKRSLKIRDNHKTRDVFEQLKYHPNIKEIQVNPIILKWINDKAYKDDADENGNRSDKVKFIEKKDNISNNDLGSTSHLSSLSHDNGEKGITNEYGFKTGENPKLPINKITKEQFDSLNGKSEEG